MFQIYSKWYKIQNDHRILGRWIQNTNNLHCCVKVILEYNVLSIVKISWTSIKHNNPFKVSGTLHNRKKHSIVRVCNSGRLAFVSNLIKKRPYPALTWYIFSSPWYSSQTLFIKSCEKIFNCDTYYLDLHFW